MIFKYVWLVVCIPIFPEASERRVLLIVGVCYRFDTFTSSHLHTYTYHLHISSSHLHIFSSSHLHICTSHLCIFTSAHLQSCLSSHLTRLPRFLSPTSSFYLLSLGRGRCQPGATKFNPLARNEGRSAKTAVKLQL